MLSSYHILFSTKMAGIKPLFGDKIDVSTKWHLTVQCNQNINIIDLTFLNMYIYFRITRSFQYWEKVDLLQFIRQNVIKLIQMLQ